MAVIGIDLGGTKLAGALFHPDGIMKHKETVALGKRRGKKVGSLITHHVRQLVDKSDELITAIGVSVPGIYDIKAGTVWAPNISGWEWYPLSDEIRYFLQSKEIKFEIDNDRVCSLLGETWQGIAQGCNNVVFLAVGTGVGAGIMIDGNILRGSTGSAGSAGWLALVRPHNPAYEKCGCFEYHASGEGIARSARKLLSEDTDLTGLLHNKHRSDITSRDVFEAYKYSDPIAVKVLHDCIEYWGMAVASILSLFNPEMIILGGGVFGPAAQFLDQITYEATKWAQPISIRHVSLKVSALGDDAALYGAGRLALLA